MSAIYAQEAIYFPLLSDFTTQQPTSFSLVSLPNAAGKTGNFSSLVVPATTCTEEEESSGYFFEDNAGLQFNNNDFIDCAYSIQFTFKIDDLSGPPGWVRLLSFTHVDDVGIYIQLTDPPTRGTLQFWPKSTVGPPNFFNSTDIYQMILIRDCTGKVSIYINGEIFDTYDDSFTNQYVPQPPNDYVIFFQDHPSVLANEASSGWVKDIYIADYTWTENEIKDRWEGFCNSFTPTDCKGKENGTAIVDDCGECLEPTDPTFNQSCTDCKGVVNGTAIVDDCGECLEPTDPTFNQSCTDCKGVVNGSALLDDCGECLEPTDPTFNQSCTDCKGIVNGLAEIDDCRECLEPSDPNFNQSCTDCKGVVNGLSVLDDCGECLEPNDPAFNQRCTDCKGVVNGLAVLDDCGECLEPKDPDFNASCATNTVAIPNAFSPNDDGLNDIFEIKGDDSLLITKYQIYNRWGTLIYHAENFPITDPSKFWDGKTHNAQDAPEGVYVYVIEVLNHTERYTGHLLIYR